ncbi:uncharacterized protein LOC143039173 [Oratosquilla oratoria]|uniref:uncharacterized protein LOC143039173 n=1 Tax=Oratosquilla oratoria TaxID=337810 RepID=UPI003F773A41
MGLQPLPNKTTKPAVGGGGGCRVVANEAQTCRTRIGVNLRRVLVWGPWNILSLSQNDRPHFLSAELRKLELDIGALSEVRTRVVKYGGGVSSFFPVNSRMRKGCVHAPNTFHHLVGLGIGNTKVTDPMFADDALLLAESLKVLVQTLESLHGGVSARDTPFPQNSWLEQVGRTCRELFLVGKVCMEVAQRDRGDWCRCRFVVVAGGTDEGFNDESFLCYLAKNKTGDYHGETNSALFIRWLTSQLLPALVEPSVVVLDNAPYHSQLTEETRCPTTATRKEAIVKWLECRSLPFPPHATRPELLLICKENRPEPRYTVDEIIRSWGHEVIRLPPAHPELNAIEQVWGCMKQHVRSTLQRFTRADLQARLQEAKLIATKEVWAGAVRRSRSFEEEYWSSDNIHESVEPVIITMDSDDEDELFIHSGME